jgi:hypothetical protein
MVLQQILIRRLLPMQSENRHDLGERRPWSEVAMLLSGQQHTCVAGLMAVRTDVFGQARRQTSQVDDCLIRRFRFEAALLCDMQFARAVAVFTADSDFLQRRICVLRRPARNGTRPA